MKEDKDLGYSLLIGNTILNEFTEFLMKCDKENELKNLNKLKEKKE